MVSAAELHKSLDRIAGTPVLVVGDVILDRYIWGKVDRISPEAPVPVVEVKRTEDRLGGAANVARNLRALGAEASVCGLVGDDREGEVIISLLGEQSINRDGLIVERGRPTSLKTRVIASVQQVVRIDREERRMSPAALQEGFAAVVDAQIEQHKAVIVSDYGKGVVSDALMRKLEAAYQAGKFKLGARPLIVDPYPSNYSRYCSMSVAKPNRREAELASGVQIVDRQSALQAGKALMQRWKAEMVLITLGEDGLLILGGNHQEGVFIDTVAQEVFDVSGAGDTVSAVFAAALASGTDSLAAGNLANLAAGVVVREVGTASVSIDRMREEINRLYR